MADKISLDQIKTDNALILDNSAPDDSITPSVDDDLRTNQLDTSANYGVNKFIIAPSGVPTSGEITVNNTFVLATEISIFNINSHLFDVSGSLANIGNGTIIHLKDEGGNFGEFAVTVAVDNTTYWTYTVISNPSNPSYTPTSKAGYISAFGGAGTDKNIIKDDLTQTGKRTQILDGNTQNWQNGIFSLTDVTITQNLQSLGNTTGGLMTLDFDADLGNMFTLDITQNFTFSFTNLTTGRFFVQCIQDGTGSRTMAVGGNVKWEGGTVGALTTGVGGAIDWLEVTSDGTNIFMKITKDWS